MRRRDAERLAQRERVELRRHHRLIEALRFVYREKHRLAGAPQLARDELILMREAGASVGQEDEPIRFLDRALGLHAHLRLDAGGILDEAARVDGHVRHRADAPETILPIARHAGNVRDDGVAGSGQNIEESRFADVRSADERDDWEHIPTRPLLRRRGSRRGLRGRGGRRRFRSRAGGAASAAGAGSGGRR